MVDVVEGDLLVVNDGPYAGTYPVKSVAQWTMSRQSAKSFARLATVSVSRKRKSKNALTGKITPAENDPTPLTGLKALVDPLDSQAAANVETTTGLDKPTQYLQAQITDSTSFIHVILERKK